MLSIGWTEMMIVAAVALIVVGPRDLPGMLRQIGKAVGSVRRMGNEFKAEFNKVTAIDEIRDIKRSIAAPLNETQAEIEKEFNSISKTGKVEPSGVIKPSDPNAQSVVDEIRSAAGMGSSLEDNGDAAKASIAASVKKAAQAQTVAMDAEIKNETKAQKSRVATAKSRSAAKSPVKRTVKPKGAKKSAKTETELKTGANKTVARKPKATAKASSTAKPKAAGEKTSARKPAAAKNAAPKVQKSDAN